MSSHFLKPLTPETEERIRRNPSLNIDSFILPSPFVADESFEKDWEHSLIWEEEREILGFMEVWTNPDRSRLHIYRQVTSPFGRAKGIGSAFLMRLAETAPRASRIDLFVWERQTETLTFYKRRGFTEKERLDWRALSFVRIEAGPEDIREHTELAGGASGSAGMAEELGKVRHDAKKAIRLLSDMAGALSAENCSRIIEDINRETTALVNTLNLFRDSVQRFRTVNLKELVLDRIVAMVEHSPVPCALSLSFAPSIPEARAHYLEAGRAIVNLVSNSLDAIKEARLGNEHLEGRISISLESEEDWVILKVEDNGIGIEGARLERGDNGLPLFVGKTTKGDHGEGQGTRQIYAAFGPEHIEVRSIQGRGSMWIIKLPVFQEREDRELRALEVRWDELRLLRERGEPDLSSEKEEIAAWIWRKRKLEILVWDLILQFGKKNNVRELFRSVLAFRHNVTTLETFKASLEEFRIETPELRRWLLDSTARLRRADALMDTVAPAPHWAAERFASFGQALGRTVIFTLDPATLSFHAADRKLAEHADFVPVLGGKRDVLLRGEFFGDLRNPADPVQLGVWEIGDRTDALRKADLLRSGARALLSLGLSPDKKLLFYSATWRRAGLDLELNKPRSLSSVAALDDGELSQLIAENDDEAGDYIFVSD